MYSARLQVDLRSQHCERKMSSLQNDGIGARSQESGTRKHGESLPGNSASPGMGAAIRRLIPGGRITRESLLDLFDRRAGHKAIEAWRYGWRGTPQWAVDLIQGKLAARAAADLAVGAKLKPGNRGSGAAGAKALAAWRERKAREKNEKEKAAQAADILSIQKSRENR